MSPRSGVSPRFFVSRVDVAVDALLPEGDPRRGTTANAQAAAAYQLYRTRAVSEEVSNVALPWRSGSAPTVGAPRRPKIRRQRLALRRSPRCGRDGEHDADATLADALDHLDPTTSYLLTKESCHETAELLTSLEPSHTRNGQRTARERASPPSLSPTTNYSRPSHPRCAPSSSSARRP